MPPSTRNQQQRPHLVALKLPEALSKGTGHRCQLMQQVVECAQAVRSHPLRPTRATGGVTKDAGTIPAVSGLRHEPTFKVPTRPDPSCRPRPLIRGDDLEGLVTRTFLEIGGKWFWIWTLIDGSRRPALRIHPHCDGLRPVAHS